MSVDLPPPVPLGIIPQIPGGLRITMAIVAVTGWVLLGVAWGLSPDPRGYGTHEQLGFAPCGVTTWFGVRCPSCGMTTSFNRLSHGDLGGAFAANPGGALLGLAWFIAAPWLAISAWRGRWCGFEPQEWQVMLVGCVILSVSIVDWLIRLMV